MISVRQRGNFSNLEKFLKKSLGHDWEKVLDEYGKRGVKALSDNTPVDTGLLKSSWYYEIVKEDGAVRVIWKNSDIENGVPVALLVVYGHGTKNGGYVEGRDFISPALQPIFDELAEAAWKEVSAS